MSTDPRSQPVKPRTPTWVLVVIVVAGLAGFCLVMAVPVALLLPALQAAREAARRNMCMNNLKQIGVALMSYHEQYGTFPPAYIADAEGKPMHSWRVLLLPYLEGESVYKQYDFNEPWNGPNNIKLANALPLNPFHCPSSDDVPPMTSYVVVVGPETAWPGSTATSIAQISRGDGSAATVAVVEAVGAGIHWMEPKDLSFDEALAGINGSGSKPKISSNHPRGVNVLFCDGSVHFLPEDTPREKIRAYLTAGGGERIERVD